LSTEPEVARFERVPRSDKLHLLRDILHLLNEMDGISGTQRLFYETKKRITRPEVDFSVESTFNDYITTGNKLDLMTVRGTVAKISEKGRKLTEISRFGEPRLSNSEKNFFKSLLFAYLPFRIFLSFGFCNGRTFVDEDELYTHAKCPTREELLTAYMKIKGQDTDREARTLLGWSIQIGLIEFDEYSGHYYLTREQSIESDSFLDELRKVYVSVRHPRTKIALIPEARFRFCCSMNLQRRFFDNYVLQLYETKPSEVQLGKGSASRDDVLKFGIKGKRFYYYYIILSNVHSDEK
jgi:hypothetical protein